EDLLARYAEPLAVWRYLLEQGTGNKEQANERTSLPARPEALVGRAEYDTSSQNDAATRGLLRHAWRLLLQNGPHDSVTGCSADAVYDDVGGRFNRCEQIAESVIYDSLRYIADRV